MSDRSGRTTAAARSDSGSSAAPAEPADVTTIITVPEDPATADVATAPAVRRTLADSVPTTGKERLADWLRHTRGRGALEIGIIFAAVQIGCIVWYLIAPEAFPYLTQANLNVLTQSIPVLAILAIGAGIVIVSGEFDLSLGANVTFCALVFTRWYSGGNNAILCFALAIGTGMSIALLNGFITTKFKIPSFIVTLGTLLFWEGMALLYNGTTAALITPSDTLTTVFTGQIGPFRGQLLWLIGLAVVFWVLMHRHRFGNHVFAVGGNPAAAKAISIDPVKVKLAAFAILGFCVAVAAVLTVVRTGSVQPGTGRGLELRAIAAAVVGGVALTGGRGSVLGMVLGAALILTVQDILLLGGAPGFYLDLFVGVIIVAAAMFNRVLEGKAE